MYSESAPRLRIFSTLDVEHIPKLRVLNPDVLKQMGIVSQVLPFRVSSYVVDELIDWSNVPDDPMFKLVFPHRDMLDARTFDALSRAVEEGVPATQQSALIDAARLKMNPHPAGQLTFNRPTFDGETIAGLQHKYRETVLFFPSEGQTCHSYCSFCFRWPQFVAPRDMRMAMSDRETLARYLAQHPDVTDLLVTGGDPFVMRASRLRFFLEPLVRPELRHVSNIRIGTKALSFWPYRFLTDSDAEELVATIRWLVDHGKHVAIMAHYNHWRELETDAAQEAIERLRSAGAIIRSQGPLLRGINDVADVWVKLWRMQVERGIVPYYMFVVRDTGPKCYFDVPIAEAWEIYSEAARQVGGLARTARGPSMSTTVGKIEVMGVSTVAGEKVFVLRLLQARNASWCYRPFFAKFDAHATWFDDLVPAFGEREFFFASKPHLSGTASGVHALGH